MLSLMISTGKCLFSLYKAGSYLSIRIGACKLIIQELSTKRDGYNAYNLDPLRLGICKHRDLDCVLTPSLVQS